MSLLSSLVSKIPVVGNVINAVAKPVDAVARGAVTALPFGSTILAAGDALGRAIPSPGGTSAAGGAASPSGVTSLLDFLNQHKDLLLGGAEALNAANLQQKAGNYANQAVNDATDPWNQKAPLRQAGVTAMLNAAQYNPYSKAPGSATPNAVNRVTPIPATSWS